MDVSSSIADGEIAESNEEESVCRIVDSLRKLHEMGSNISSPTKTHGLLRGALSVEKDLPDGLRNGIFYAPGHYQSWIRFSNTHQWDDRKKDAHSIAVKVSGVDALGRNSQDFIGLDHPTFFAANASDYADYFETLYADATNRRLRNYLDSWNRTGWKLGKMRRSAKMQSHCSNLLNREYFSGTAYRLGHKIVKFKFSPAEKTSDSVLNSFSKNGLSENLATQMTKNEAVFDLRVQMQIDPRQQPTNDPTTDWSKTDVPIEWIKVAELRIPRQNPLSFERATESSALDFAQWNCIPAHAPLGSIYRVRKAAYDILASESLYVRGLAETGFIGSSESQTTQPRYQVLAR